MGGLLPQEGEEGGAFQQDVVSVGIGPAEAVQALHVQAAGPFVQHVQGVCLQLLCLGRPGGVALEPPGMKEVSPADVGDYFADRVCQ